MDISTKQKYTKEELGTLVAVTLDATGINPKGTVIDSVIPDSVLHGYDPLDILRVAYEHGFRITHCRTCPSPNQSYKANGVWVRPDKELADKISERGYVDHATCLTCYGLYAVPGRRINDSRTF